MDLLRHNWGKLTGAGAGMGAALLFLAKDAIREWWIDRHEQKKAELEEKRIQQQQGFGDKLANELLVILREDLKGNAELLRELTVTMGEFRDIMRDQYQRGIETLEIARETRESQKWLERRYGREADQ